MFTLKVMFNLMNAVVIVKEIFNTIRYLMTSFPISENSTDINVPLASDWRTLSKVSDFSSLRKQLTLMRTSL